MEDTAEVVQIIPQEHLQQRTVDQEQIIAGETARNIVGFPPVLEQVKVQEIPEVHRMNENCYNPPSNVSIHPIVQTRSLRRQL